MYSVETAKMSSKGQLVIPDTFRKQYGWKTGMTLLMIGTGNAVVLQSLQVPGDEVVDKVIKESKIVNDSVSRRVKQAKAALDKLVQLGITMPDGVEKGETRRAALMEKYS